MITYFFCRPLVRQQSVEFGFFIHPKSNKERIQIAIGCLEVTIFLTKPNEVTLKRAEMAIFCSEL